MFSDLQSKNRELTIPPLDYGSIIVKTVWEVFHATSKADQFDEIPVVDGLLLADPTALGSKNSLSAPLLWSGGKQHSAGLDVASQDGESLGPSQGGSFPKSCFMLLSLQGNDKNLQQEMSGLITAGTDPFLNNPRYLALVGVNIMELEPAYPHWMWSAFWWTKETNKSVSSLPQWKHFAGCATSKTREMDTSVCFNPYLEAVVGDNGIISNCRTCHQYAAYGPNTTVNQQRADGTCLGAPGLPDLKGKVTSSCKKTPDQYHQSSLSTRFLWSLADLDTPKK
jgi:hypothetical protein